MVQVTVEAPPAPKKVITLVLDEDEASAVYVGLYALEPMTGGSLCEAGARVYEALEAIAVMDTILTEPVFVTIREELRDWKADFQIG